MKVALFSNYNNYLFAILNSDSEILDLALATGTIYKGSCPLFKERIRATADKNVKFPIPTPFPLHLPIPTN